MAHAYTFLAKQVMSAISPLVKMMKHGGKRQAAGQSGLCSASCQFRLTSQRGGQKASHHANIRTLRIYDTVVPLSFSASRETSALAGLGVASFGGRG